MVKLNNVKREAHARFATKLGAGTAVPSPPYKATDIDPASNATDKEVFFTQVNLLIVATLIKNCLMVAGWDDLMQRKEEFFFLDSHTSELYYDGPVMLKIIL